jgi:DNA polymerase I-like protein with 3'-5' exonuclease and polymerase domains
MDVDWDYGELKEEPIVYYGEQIYFVTGQSSLFGDEDRPYKCISVEESLELLSTLKVVGLDSETKGTEIWQGTLLLLQLGNKKFQVVIDCLTVDVKRYKSFLESDRLFIIHNAKFDLRWLYKEGIVVRNVYDTFLGEKILFLGFPPGIVSLSLQACVKRYRNVELDKTVRGKINGGLTDEVIIYSANDVVWLEDVMNEQVNLLTIRKQLAAMDIENRFVRVLAYIEYCGIRLDVNRWKAKMMKDEIRLREAETKLNEWVVNYVLSKGEDAVIAYDITGRRGKKKRAKASEGKYVAIDPQRSLFEESKPRCIINWNSNKQVIPLFEELGFELWTKDRKTGRLKKSVDSKLIKRQKDKSDIVPLYLEYSAAFKVVTSFGQNFIDAVNPVTGRIHPTFNQMMDTGRLSCGKGGKKGGGKTKDDDVAEDETELNADEVIAVDKSVNIQQLPSDPETRACFIPSEGHLLVDCDYGDQEGHVFTELTQDKAWIEFYNDPAERDGHAFVAKMIFPDELKDIPENEVKAKRKDLRDAAKPARFTFNYNGTAPALAANTGKPLDFCEKCFKTYFNAFKGIDRFFKVSKKNMWDRGYILISEYTGLRAYIYDWPILKGIEKRKNSMGQEYWDLYRKAKESGMVIDDVPGVVMQEIAKKFAQGDPLSAIAIRYEYKAKKGDKTETKYIDINWQTVIVKVFKHLSKRKSSSENQSCNYTSQGTAAAMTKIAGIMYFDYLVDSGLIFKVLIPNDVHDEYLTEPPAEIAEQEAKKLSECMEYAASLFCKSVTIKAVPEIADHWVH